MPRRTAALTRAILVTRYPHTFKGKGESKYPLKIGIFHDIRQALPWLTSREVYEALRDYTSGRTYLRNMVEGASRVDLNGDLDGIVTAEQAEHARDRLIALNIKPFPKTSHCGQGAQTVNQISQNAFTSATPLTHAPGTLMPSGFAESVHHLLTFETTKQGADLVAARDKANIEYGRTLGPAPISDKAAVLTEMVALLDQLRSGRKIEAIKTVRTMTGMGLKEAKEWVEGLQEVMPAPVPPPPQPERAYYKPSGFLVLQRNEDNYGSAYEVMRTDSYRDDAAESAAAVVKDSGVHRETILVEVIGRTKPVFSML